MIDGRTKSNDYKAIMDMNADFFSPTILRIPLTNAFFSTVTINSEYIRSVEIDINKIFTRPKTTPIPRTANYSDSMEVSSGAATVTG